MLTAVKRAKALVVVGSLCLAMSACASQNAGQEKTSWSHVNGHPTPTYTGPGDVFAGVVPNVVGLTFRDAKSKLAKAGYLQTKSYGSEATDQSIVEYQVPTNNSGQVSKSTVILLRPYVP